MAGKPLEVPVTDYQVHILGHGVKAVDLYMELCYFFNVTRQQMTEHPHHHHHRSHHHHNHHQHHHKSWANISDVTTISSADNGTDIHAEFEFEMAELIWQICPVILFVFGTLGNTAIILTLRHLRLGRTSMHIYLRALAMSDLCVLYTGLLRWWIVWTFKTDLRTEHVALCKIHTWLVYVSISVSTWLLVVMTLERTCSTCLPYRVVACCTTKRAIFCIIFIVVFHGGVQSHFLFGLALRVDETKGTIECNSDTEGHGYFVHEIWPLIDLCMFSLLPFICLTIGNAIIVWKTCVSLRTVAIMSTSAGSTAQRRRKRASTMTVILLSLSSLFLLTTSPVCVYNIWERNGNAAEFLKTTKGEARLELIWAIISNVMYSNNTFNFYLYCLTGKKFRIEMIRRMTRTRSDSQSYNLSGPVLQRFVVLNEANRIHAQSCREVTPLRASSVRFNSP